MVSCFPFPLQLARKDRKSSEKRRRRGRESFGKIRTGGEWKEASTGGRRRLRKLNSTQLDSTQLNLQLSSPHSDFPHLQHHDHPTTPRPVFSFPSIFHPPHSTLLSPFLRLSGSNDTRDRFHLLQRSALFGQPPPTTTAPPAPLKSHSIYQRGSAMVLLAYF